MKIIRWISFLPVALVVICVAQLLTGAIADKFSWFWGVPLLFFSGGLIAVGSGASVSIAPTPKIGAAIVLTLFLLLEVIALFTSVSRMSTAGFVIRLYTDVVIVLGALIPATKATSPD